MLQQILAPLPNPGRSNIWAFPQKQRRRIGCQLLFHRRFGLFGPKSRPPRLRPGLSYFGVSAHKTLTKHFDACGKPHLFLTFGIDNSADLHSRHLPCFDHASEESLGLPWFRTTR